MARSLRSTLAAGALAAGALLSVVALPSGVASAAPDDPSAQAPAPADPALTSPMADWGWNRDGWDVEIQNHSGQPLIFDTLELPFINDLQSHSPQIGTGGDGSTGTGTVKGKGRVGLEGPRDIRFAYKATNGARGVTTINTNLDGVFKETKCTATGNIRCKIVEPLKADQPITVVFDEA